jgi:lipopolysaccharide export system permease protein
VALLASGLLWINNQYVYPKLIRRYHYATESDFGRKTILPTTSRLGVVLFPGGSRLFFGTYDQRRQCIEDVFWVRSPDCVVHIENLRYFMDRQPEGQGIDVVERGPDGKMRKTASYDSHELAELKLNKQTLLTATANPSDLSITQLASFISRSGSFRSERSVETTLSLYHKVFFPLLALLALLIPAPLCLRFEHRLPQPILVFLSLSCLFCFLLIVQASFVLAKAPLFPIAPVVLMPWTAAFFIALRRVFRLS